jgi:FkbM family methyltransferase
MIKFIEYSQSEKKLKYRNTTATPLPVKIDFYEGHTSSFMFTSRLELSPDPGIYHYTMIPPKWKNMRAYFYHGTTNELLAPFVFDGDIDIKNFDYGNYLTKIQSENTLGQQAGVNDVLREHFSDRKYENIVDVELGDVVVDIGFNYGIFSLGALYKGASRIYGFEPNKNIFQKLKDYPRQDIDKIFNCAVSNKYERLKFCEGDNTLGSSININVDDFKESYDVECVNFYDFIIKNNINKIDFLKIDCEGTEYEIIDSIPDEFFKTIKKLHVEFHDNDGERVKSIIKKLEQNNFEWVFEEGKDINSKVGLIFAKKNNIN